MKIHKFLPLPFCSILLIGCPFLTSCDGGDEETVANTVQTPPSNPSVAATISTTTSTTGAVVANQASYGNQVFANINTERNSRSLPSLTRDANLDAIAASQNVYMAQQAPANANPIQISHDNFRSRANAAFSRGFTSFGENVAGLRGYAANVVASTYVTNWINSPGHFANITGDYTHTGVDVLVAADGTIYATQVFAK